MILFLIFKNNLNKKKKSYISDDDEVGSDLYDRLPLTLKTYNS